VVIGDGPALKRLKGIAKDNISFLGKVDFDSLKWHFARCKALIFPGEEDFGIIPVEVLASGRPVIGLAKGGLLDIFGEESVGQLFDDASVSSLHHAIELFEQSPSDFSEGCVRRSRKFTKDIFTSEFRTVVEDTIPL
jgi:glycosyltransferase involved in cell wall biosynthesis